MDEKLIIWTDKPDKAWVRFILPALSSPAWVEDSSDISRDIKLSKRELLGLILIAHALNAGAGTWLVGYDPNDGDQNDGHVTDGKTKLIIEHKLVPQMDRREVLEAIKGTYAKYEGKGDQYGKDRILIIQPNKASSHGGMIKISALTDMIDNQSHFDRVLIMGAVANESEKFIWHLIQHYPREKGSGAPITQVDIFYKTGKGEVMHQGINWKV